MEWKALKELKEDKSRMVLTADKGVALVVMDTAEYKKKAEDLLQQPTYKPIPTDPTSKYKTKIINMLKSIKAEGGISEAVYKKLYPTGAGSPKFYGLPKIHKEEGATETNCIKYWGSNLSYCKRIGQDPQTTGRKITISVYKTAQTSFNNSKASNYNPTNVWCHLMWRHFSHLCLSNQPFPSLRSCWKKITHCSRGQQCQWTTSPAC